MLSSYKGYRLLLVHAHPDDETINNGSTMAMYAALGAKVTLVTCTRGEEGEVLVPELAHYYDSVRTKGLDIEVYAVGMESDPKLWKDFIVDHKLKWVNVSDLYNNTNFRNYFDIYSTPVIYLLDEQKRIIAKRLDPVKLKDFIDRDSKEKK